MIEIKKEANYVIDWLSVCNPTKESEDITKIQEDRKHYFNMLRRLLTELSNLNLEEQGLIDGVFEKYNVHFVDIDDIERVNIDEPKGD